MRAQPDGQNYLSAHTHSLGTHMNRTQTAPTPTGLDPCPNSESWPRHSPPPPPFWSEPPLPSHQVPSCSSPVLPFHPLFSLPRPILPCSRTLPYFQRTLYTRSSHSAPSPHLAHLPLRSPFPTSRHYRPTHAGEPDGQNTSRPTHTVSARFAVDPSPLSSQSPSRLTARTVAPWRER